MILSYELINHDKRNLTKFLLLVKKIGRPKFWGPCSRSPRHSPDRASMWTERKEGKTRRLISSKSGSILVHLKLQ